MQRVLHKLISPNGGSLARLAVLPEVQQGVNIPEAAQCDNLLRRPQILDESQQLEPLDGNQSEPVMIMPNILLAKKGDDDCKKLEKKKKDTVCKAPDLRPKEIPPYEYGFCKEPTPPMPMSCPPKAVRSNKGPCCHEDTGSSKSGGCKKK